MKRIINIIVTMALSIETTNYLHAQQPAQDASADATNGMIVIEPLFEYPTPPDTMINLNARANYIVENFWKPMDFKSKSTVDQNALNHAFEVYTTAMRFADEAKVEESVKKLIANISKSQAMSLQFAKGAEEALYSDRATIWNDRLFLIFLDNVLNNKHIKKERKLRYQDLRNKISNTLQGTVPPEFDYKTPEGKTAHYSPNGVITVIEFGDPDCMDCRMAKLRMDTDVTFSTLVDKGKVNVLFIDTTADEGWQDKLKTYPSTWHVGASEDVDEIYDIRHSPTIYVIDREGNVAAKHIDVDTAMQIAGAAAQQ
jgi:hypothetical protein